MSQYATMDSIISSLCMLIYVQVACAGTAMGKNLSASEIVVFRNGEDGYPFYRIPSLISTRSSLLAFSEGRGQPTDHGRVDIVFKRSLDLGHTWSKLHLVYSEQNSTHKATIGNPTALYDESVSPPRLVVFFCKENLEIFQTTSIDDGMSWDPPQQLAWERPGSWKWVAAGPPSAIRSKTGR